MKKGTAAHKTLGTLLHEAAGTQPILPALQPWEQRLQQMKVHVVGITRSCMDFAKLVDVSIKEKDYERFGFADPGDFFQEKLGIAWRTVYRYLAPMRAVQALPADQQEQAIEKLAKLGIHKAATIAPAIEKEPAMLDSWVRAAEVASQEALQEQVSTKLGLRPRGLPTGAKDPGEPTLQFLLRRFPPELATSWEAAFRAWVKHEGFETTISGLANLELLMRAKVMQDKGELPG